MHRLRSRQVRISLRVDRVLRGDVVKGATIAVLKPAGAYEVAIGTHGPFLLGSADDAGVAPVLGRYGPDTWRAEVVERAFQAT